ncbi:hypothetical protein GY12_12340 [Micrococcus luteus]|nr:hypothetical protein GY12_12340 [Micrococcus luteus]
MLPLALSLPASPGPGPLVVVTQTLVELGAMVSLVRLVPGCCRCMGSPRGGRASNRDLSAQNVAFP